MTMQQASKNEKVFFQNENLLVTDKRISGKAIHVDNNLITSCYLDEASGKVYRWIEAIFAILVFYFVSDEFYFIYDGSDILKFITMPIGFYIAWQFIRVKYAVIIGIKTGKNVELDPKEILGPDWESVKLQNIITEAVGDEKNQNTNRSKSSPSLEDELNSLNSLLEKKLITQEEFDIKRKKLIDL